MGTVLWFTGLSGSGKTTIATEIKSRLEELGKCVIIIDADDMREKYHSRLGFSREDIRENNRRIAEFVKEKILDYDVVLVPIISPFREDRATVRTILGKAFVELYVNASLGTCIERDTKGMYKKALNGEMDNLIGVSVTNPYEPPKRPDIEVCTDAEDLTQSVQKIIRLL